MDTKTLDELQGIAEKATRAVAELSDWGDALGHFYCKNCELRIYEGSMGWRHHGSNHAECFGAAIVKLDPQTALTLIAEARKVQELETELSEFQLGLGKVQAKLAESRSENKQLREALEKYGVHEEVCLGDEDCDCGLSAALSPKEKSHAK